MHALDCSMMAAVIFMLARFNNRFTTFLFYTTDLADELHFIDFSTLRDIKKKIRTT